MHLNELVFHVVPIVVEKVRKKKGRNEANVEAGGDKSRAMIIGGSHD